MPSNAPTPKVLGWRPEIDRLQLRMNIREMQQGNLTLAVKAQEIILGEFLLCCCARSV